MEIKRYNIPKLPRSKYNVSGKYLGSASVVTNYNADVYDDLDSTSVTKSLSANQGRVLNAKISNLKTDLKLNTDRLYNRFDVVNISYLSNQDFRTLSDAVTWLVNNQTTYKYRLHKGIRLRYRQYYGGKWLTYIYSNWGSEEYFKVDNWVIQNDSETVNITYNTNNCPNGIKQAVEWLVNDKEKYGYNLKIGMLIKFRDYYSGEWLTYLYRGSNNDWKNTDFGNPDHWTLHSRQNALEVVDNLKSSEAEKALSANQGRVLNSYKLSKMTPDTARGLITFDKGLISNGNIAVGGYATNPMYGVGIYKITESDEYDIMSDTFTARVSADVPTIYANDEIRSNVYSKNNQGYSLYKDSAGKYNLDIDNANIRGKLNVKTLQIEEAKYIGGKLYCTMAGIVISKVELVNDGNTYRCYFNNDKDGVTIHNQFQQYDLAFCQTFNNNKIRKWWRTVEDTGTDYIDLSVDYCDIDSDIPEVGDNVVQLGNSVNKDRQGAVVIEPLGINVYNGIDDFILPEPIISFNPSNTKIDADQINFIGQTLINNNFKVDTKGNLDINGKITSTEGKIGNFNITKEGLSNDAAKGLASILITDSRAEPEVGFSVGANKEYVIGGYSRYKNVLDCSTEFGTAVKAYSRSGWGLIASKTRVEGLHITPQYVTDTEGEIVLSPFVDFYIFGNTKPMTVAFPETNTAVGKIYIIKRIGAGKLTLKGNIITNTSYQVTPEYVINGNIPKKFISDGNKWFEI